MPSVPDVSSGNRFFRNGVPAGEDEEFSARSSNPVRNSGRTPTDGTPDDSDDDYHEDDDDGDASDSDDEETFVIPPPTRIRDMAYVPPARLSVEAIQRMLSEQAAPSAPTATQSATYNYLRSFAESQGRRF